MTRLTPAGRRAGLAAGEYVDVVPGGDQVERDGVTEEPGSPGDEDPHD